MLNRRTLAGLAVLAASSAACGGDDDTTSPAPTTAPTGSNGSTADLQIRYEHPDAGVSFEYGIECGPNTSEASGAVEQAEIDAAAACDLLGMQEVVDRLRDGPDDEICTEIYGGPDTAEITGTLRGQEVDATIDRTDGCGINDWDELLDELLPPAIGVEAPATADY
jgi:hypothetical protein